MKLGEQDFRLQVSEQYAQNSAAYFKVLTETQHDIELNVQNTTIKIATLLGSSFAQVQEC